MLTQQSGQSENLPDQSAVRTTQTIASDATTTEHVISPSDYIPAVGDVVEFEYKGSPKIGIVYDGDTIVWDYVVNDLFCNSVSTLKSVSDNGIRKVNRIADMESLDFYEAKELWRTYFSKHLLLQTMAARPVPVL